MRADSVLDLGGAQVPMGFGSLEEEHGARKPCFSRADYGSRAGGQGNSVLLFENGSYSYGNDPPGGPSGAEEGHAGRRRTLDANDVRRCGAMPEAHRGAPPPAAAQPSR